MIKKYEIEKDVPFTGRIPTVDRFPLEEMKPGDSFLIPPEDVKDGQESAKIRSNIMTWANTKRRDGQDIVVKTSVGIDGIRVWRLK